MQPVDQPRSVVDYDDALLRDALHRLERRGLVRLASGAGSRAAKYRHLLAERLPMDSAEQAIMCVLMLRGPQTPGELKQRGERMHSFGELAEVHDALQRLIERELATRLARRPGHKEERYAQLLQEDALAREAGEQQAPVAAPAFSSVAAPIGDGAAAASGARAPEAAPGYEDAAARALQELSERVARIERELSELREAVQPPSPAPAP